VSKHPTPESGLSQEVAFSEVRMQQPAPGAMTRLEPAHDDDEPIQSESADMVYSEVQPPEVLTKEGWLLV
jgi:hypothetical protein